VHGLDVQPPRREPRRDPRTPPSEIDTGRGAELDADPTVHRVHEESGPRQATRAELEADRAATRVARPGNPPHERRPQLFHRHRSADALRPPSVDDRCLTRRGRRRSQGLGRRMKGVVLRASLHRPDAAPPGEAKVLLESVRSARSGTRGAASPCPEAGGRLRSGRDRARAGRECGEARQRVHAPPIGHRAATVADGLALPRGPGVDRGPPSGSFLVLWGRRAPPDTAHEGD